MDWATKDTFFAAKVPHEKMEIPGIGRIEVYGLTSGQKDDYENSILRLGNSGRSREVHLANARAKLIQMTVRTSQGKPMFTDADLGRICNIPAAVTDPILDVVRRLNGMDAKELDELVKNSQAAQEPQGEDLPSV